MQWSPLWQESSAEESWNYLPKFACSSILNVGEKREKGDPSWRSILLGCMIACHMHENWTDCILAILRHWFMLWQKPKFPLREPCLEACREIFWNWKFETQQYLKSWWERKRAETDSDSGDPFWKMNWFALERERSSQGIFQKIHI